MADIPRDVLLAALIETGITALHSECRAAGCCGWSAWTAAPIEDDGTDSTDIGVRVFTHAVFAPQAGHRPRVVEPMRQAEGNTCGPW